MFSHREIISSPAHPMDLDENEFFSRRTTPNEQQTPRTKMFFSSSDVFNEETPSVFRIVHNPFDPPTSAHLKQRLASPSIFQVLSQNEENDRMKTKSTVFDWTIEQLAELHPKRFSEENLIQIDAGLFDENLMQRYQRAADEFCVSKLHLPTPAAPQSQNENIFSNENYGFFCSTTMISSMTSPFPHFDLKTTKSIFQRDFLSRPPTDFDSCIMEQCNEMASSSLLETSFNATNQSVQTSRLSTSVQTNNNVSFLKRRLFEDEEEEEEDVNLLPEDEEPMVNAITNSQPKKSPPRCDSETEDDHRNSSPSDRLKKQQIISPISSLLFDVDCSPIRKG